jgi:hypothetical protein
MTRMIQLLALVLCLITIPTYGDAPSVEWDKGFGTDNGDHVHEGMQTRDGGYIAIGQTSEGRRSKFQNMLIVKTDAAGKEQWQRTVGTAEKPDVGICVIETADGFIAGGGLYAEDSQKMALVKFDAAGSTVWEKTYPTTGHGAIRGIASTSDGNFVVTGYTDASRGGFIFIVEEGKGFIKKVDADGNALWEKPLSAPQGTKVRVKENGTLAVASTQWFSDEEKDTVHQDVVLMLTDKEGNERGTYRFGGPKDDQCYDFVLTDDGGYILAGHTRGYGSVNWDYLLLKVGPDETEQWHKTFGQPRGYDAEFIHDESYGVRQTPDGGYLIAGGSGDEFSYSESGHPAGPSDEWKAYVVKTDADGNTLWEGLYGAPDSGNNAAEYIALTDDGGFIIFSDSDSHPIPRSNNFGFIKAAPDTP